MKPVSIAAILSFLLLASCSRESHTDTAGEIKAEDAPAVTDLKHPANPTLESELELLCQNLVTLPAPFSDIRTEVREAVLNLYRQRAFQSYWFDGEALLEDTAIAAVEALSLAESHALDPAKYHAGALKNRMADWKRLPEKIGLRKAL